MQCDGCGKRFRGSGLSVLLEGKQKTFCADCYGRIREEYDKKKKCDDCSHFDDESCELTGSKLKPIPIGYKDYFVQAEKCANYIDETQNAQKTIENFEKAGRYEEAAQGCEKLGMLEKAGQLRRKGKEITVLHIDVNSLIKQLADRGQTLTYHCCHCGAPLKIGAKSEEVFKICPNCGYSLEIIDLAKLINQHLS
jgi:ribosome-binding protein aMBF1 (putative translation factor)